MQITVAEKNARGHTWLTAASNAAAGKTQIHFRKMSKHIVMWQHKKAAVDLQCTWIFKFRDLESAVELVV